MSTRRRAALDSQSGTSAQVSALQISLKKSLHTDSAVQAEAKAPQNIYKKTYPLSDGIGNSLADGANTEAV
jgi:hypothetical protein